MTYVVQEQACRAPHEPVSGTASTNISRVRSLPFKFIDLFAGIGGMRFGLEAVGGQCCFSSEWDPFAKTTYEEWFGEEPKGDINAVDLGDIPEHDVLAAGFPCQPFSIAGVSKKNALGREHGFLDLTQGTLFYRILEIMEDERLRPPVVLLENVKNLKSHDGGRTWIVIEGSLKDLGYAVFPEVINAIHWVPQNRERVFIVGFDKRVFGEDVAFGFPAPPNRRPKLGAILEELTPEQEQKYGLSDHLWTYLQDYKAKHRARGNGFGFGLVGPKDTTRTLSARYHKDGSEILVRRENRTPRRLTPREAQRLMGFPKRPIVVSDTQAYRQFGNAVVPKVVEAVAREIIQTMTARVLDPDTRCLVKKRSGDRR